MRGYKCHNANRFLHLESISKHCTNMPYKCDAHASYDAPSMFIYLPLLVNITFISAVSPCDYVYTNPSTGIEYCVVLPLTNYFDQSFSHFSCFRRGYENIVPENQEESDYLETLDFWRNTT